MVARRSRFLVAGTVLAAALVLATPGAGARRRVADTAVGVGAREFHLAAYRASAPAGVVRFNLTNYGQDAHDLVVRDRSGRTLGRTGRVRSGARATLALRLRPGTYRLVCDLSNHEALGMRTTIRVTR